MSIKDHNLYFYFPFTKRSSISNVIVSVNTRKPLLGKVSMTSRNYEDAIQKIGNLILQVVVIIYLFLLMMLLDGFEEAVV